MSVSAVYFALALATSSNLDRLRHDSFWDCVPIGSDDQYSMTFTITQGETGLQPKKLLVVKSSGELPIGTSGYGTSAEPNSYYDANKARNDPYYLYHQFTEGFYDYGLQAIAGWKAASPDIELNLHTFNYEFRRDPNKRQERVFVFNCVEAKSK